MIKLFIQYLFFQNILLNNLLDTGMKIVSTFAYFLRAAVSVESFMIKWAIDNDTHWSNNVTVIFLLGIIF